MSTTESQGTYSLPRNPSESERLNSQHRCWLSSFGYHVHPEIVKSLPSDARIADIATGTGIWLTDLASNSPSSYQFNGLDISNVQFPTSHAKNVNFGLLNVLEPVPEEHKAKYDLIHIRLIMAGMSRDDDWSTAACHVLEMLKPGGFVQWEEFDVLNMRVFSQDPGSNNTALRRIRDDAIERNFTLGKTTDASVRLVSTLKSVGFESSQEYVTSSDRDPSMRQLYSQVTMGALTGTIGWCLEQGLPGSLNAEVFRKATEEGMKYIEDGKAYLQSAIICDVGRKAV